MKLRKFTDLNDLTAYFKDKYECESIYVITETDGTTKIPRYNYVIMVSFMQNKLNNFLKLIEMIKTQKYLLEAGY